MSRAVGYISTRSLIVIAGIYNYNNSLREKTLVLTN
jgi:hypothetical protein